MDIYNNRERHFYAHYQCNYKTELYGDMLKPADRADLKSVAIMREGSSPSIPTSEVTRK